MNIQKLQDSIRIETSDLYLGYGKIRGTWGLYLSYNDSKDTNEWLFNEAPRDFRIKASYSLELLLEKLLIKAASTLANMRSSEDYVREVIRKLKS
jgi:hypothetical protein